MASVVVGYVPAPEGAAALAHARREAALFQDRLVIINVRTTGRGLGHGHTHGEDAAEELEAIARELEGTDFRLVHPEGDYDPAEEILAAADRYDARLIVVGLRHRTPVGKLILGSTSQRVLIDAPCPVLCVKAGQDAPGN